MTEPTLLELAGALNALTAAHVALGGDEFAGKMANAAEAIDLKINPPKAGAAPDNGWQPIKTAPRGQRIPTHWMPLPDPPKGEP